MPIPIQIGSITDRLRNFFRIRGRTRFTLDETVVPVVQLQDLSTAPYQAGVTPAAGTIVNSGTAGGQVVIFLNPDATIPMAANLDEDPRFIGRSFNIQSLELRQRALGLVRYRVGSVPRAIVTGATITVMRRLVNVQVGTGISFVPVVLAVVPAIPFVIFPSTSEWHHAESLDASQLVKIPQIPITTIDRFNALIIEELLAGSLVDVSVRGFYQDQAP